MWSQLEEHLRECGAPTSLVPFQNYVALLLENRSRLNLTGITSPAEAVSLHLLDALEILRRKGFHSGDRGIDVGSGPGIPGIPLAMALPGCTITLLDSRGKKVDCLRSMCERLRLKNASVLAGRAESVGRHPAYRERFDFAVTRALAPPPVALECCLPLVRPAGKAFLWVGPSFDSADISHALEVLGGRLHSIHHYTLHPDRRRAIVEVVKQHETPGQYPRKPGIPRKRPLR